MGKSMKTEVEHCKHFDYNIMNIKDSCPLYGNGKLCDATENTFRILMRCLGFKECKYYED